MVIVDDLLLLVTKGNHSELNSLHVQQSAEAR